METSYIDHTSGAMFSRSFLRKASNDYDNYLQDPKNDPDLSNLPVFERNLGFAAHLGVALEDHADPVATAAWAAGRDSIDCENLAWAAAHIVDAHIVYGDVDKKAMYRRLAALSAAELDAGFALIVLKQASGFLPHLPRPDSEVIATQAAHRVLFAERESALLANIGHAASAMGEGKAVVAVVGRAHLAGMQRLWANKGWHDVLRKEMGPAAGMTAPAGFGKKQQRAQTGRAPRQSAVRRARMAALELESAAGVRRAIADATMRLLTNDLAVLDTTAEAHGPVPPADFGPYANALALYCSMHMLLATLTKAQLACIFGERAPRIYKLLEPVRARRVLRGGLVDEELAPIVDEEAWREAYDGVISEVEASIDGADLRTVSLLVWLLSDLASKGDELNSTLKRRVEETSAKFLRR